MKYFKGDDLEKKFYEVARTLFNSLSDQRAEFFSGAYESYKLGELIHDNELVPIASSIQRSIFREAFQSIFETFLEAGSFEGYLEIFKKIFGDTVDVTFTVPAAGRLQIDIVADGIVLDNIVGREIVDDEYVSYPLVDENNDFVVGQSIKGFETQYEVEQMLFELVPQGIFTEITLTLGA